MRVLQACALLGGLLWFGPQAARAAVEPLLAGREPGLPPSRYPFRSYGAELGLDNLAIRRLTQDADGFLWVATEDGLYRWDGGRFHRYGLPEGLPSSWIVDLLPRPDGDLWVCTQRGVAHGSAAGFAAVAGTTTGIPDGACNGLAEDALGHLWIAHAGGLYRSADGLVFRRLAGWSARDATALCVDPRAPTDLVAAGSGVVARVSNGRLVGGAPLVSGWSEPIDALAFDGDGNLWAQTARHLFRQVAGEKAFRDVSSDLPPVSSRGFISVDRAGRLWVPTDEGVSYHAGGAWHRLGPAEGLPTDWARYVFEDREGSLWIGSLGLHRLIGGGAWTSWTRSEGFPSDVIWCIRRSRTGELWVGTDKGLCRATPRGWVVVPGTKKSVVRWLHEDPRGIFWLGAVPAEVLRWDPATGEIVRFGRAAGVTGKRILSITTDSEGELWVATDGAGLLRFRPAERRFAPDELPGGTATETFRSLLVDHHGRLWATGEQGLACRVAGRWRRFGRADGLLRDHVAYLTETLAGDLWLAYFEPLGIARARFDGEHFRVLEALDRDHGLTVDKVYSLGEDVERRLWIGTGRGVDVLGRGGIVHSGKGDGLAGDDCDANAFLAERDGSVFLGTSSGLSLHRGSLAAAVAGPPWPRLLAARLGSEPLPLPPQPPAVAPYWRDTLEVSFAGLSFLNEDQVQYEVRLVGLEDDWRRTPVREARFTHLPAGDFRFEMRTRLANGPWSAPAGVSFSVRPPWWRTAPALGGGLLVLALVAQLVFRWRVRQLSRHANELQQVVEERTRELATANAKLADLSITDPLTGLRNRRFLTIAMPEEVARARRAYRQWGAGGGGPRPTDADLLFLLVDLDRFKEVNDTFGHDSGDLVLRQICEVLAGATRAGDTVVRWGGEEFLIVARGVNRVEAAPLAERIRTQVAAYEFELADGRHLRRTCSLGYAALPLLAGDFDALSWEEIVALADHCLYAAKRSGRDAWVGVRATEETGEGVADRVRADLAAAAASGLVKVESNVTGQRTLKWS